MLISFSCTANTMRPAFWLDLISYQASRATSIREKPGGKKHSNCCWIRPSFRWNPHVYPTGRSLLTISWLMTKPLSATSCLACRSHSLVHWSSSPQRIKKTSRDVSWQNDWLSSCSAPKKTSTRNTCQKSRVGIIILLLSVPFFNNWLLVTEKLIESLKTNTSPHVQSQILLCFRVLLLRMSHHHLTSLWPFIYTEMVCSLQLIRLLSFDDEILAVPGFPSNRSGTIVQLCWLQVRIIQNNVICAMFCPLFLWISSLSLFSLSSFTAHHSLWPGEVTAGTNSFFLFFSCLPHSP